MTLTSANWKFSTKQIGYEGQKYCAYFWVTDWCLLALGVSVDLHCPNIEIHLPFGFIRIGVHQLWRDYTSKEIHQ